MLPTVRNPAVLELEDDAAVNIQLLAVSLRSVVMNADHAAVIICKHVMQCGLEGPSRLPHQPAEVGKGRLAAVVVASEGASPWLTRTSVSDLLMSTRTGTLLTGGRRPSG